MRALLVLFIRILRADFRRTFGADMLATFDDRWREHPSWRLAARTIADLFRSAALLHLAALRQTGHGNQNRSKKGDGLMIALAQDLRFAFRMLWRGPVFAAVVVAVVAIGIGANSAIFSLLDAALFRPLPFTHPDQLVMLSAHPPRYPPTPASPLPFLASSVPHNALHSS